MRIVLAPDKFKSTLSAIEAARAMEIGIRRALPDAKLDLCPMADGGEGTVDALVSATSGTIHTRRVTGPLPELKVDARFGMLGDGTTAIIEMSAASGLALLKPEDRNPMRTTTFGTGELLMAAVEIGAKQIILGIGGSATVDGGVGCAQACGLPVILQDGEPLSSTEPLTGADVGKVVLIKHGRGSAIERLPITVACDVTNPLCGPRGAAAVFGPQKGATPDQVRKLDANLFHLARSCGKLDIAELPGAGAAGGLGFGMAAFFGATLRSGIDLVIDACHLRSRLTGADLCLTGEGRFDSQSLSGKTVHGVAKACGELKIPCIVLAGSVESNLDLKHSPIKAAIAISDDPNQAMARAADLLADAAEKVIVDYFPK